MTMAWYFALTPWLPLRLLALVWLVYAMVVSAFGGFIKAVVLFKVILGVFGATSKVFAAIVLLVGYPGGLALAAFPPVSYLGQLLALPAVWRREGTAANRLGLSLVLLIVGAIAAAAAQWAMARLITWIGGPLE